MTFWGKESGRNNELSSYLNTLSQGVLLRRFHLVFGIPSTVFTTPYLISVDSFWFIWVRHFLSFLLPLLREFSFLYFFGSGFETNCTRTYRLQKNKKDKEKKKKLNPLFFKNIFLRKRTPVERQNRFWLLNVKISPLFNPKVIKIIYIIWKLPVGCNKKKSNHQGEKILGYVIYTLSYYWHRVSWYVC